MRKGMAQGLARPADYDRNSVVKNNQYSATAIAPHGSTSRWSYTVPAGKKTRVASSYCGSLRDAAGTTAGYLQTYIMYTPSGGSASFLLLVNRWDIAIGSSGALALASSLIMNAGDTLVGWSADGGTGGTNGYFISWSGDEFDA